MSVATQPGLHTRFPVLSGAHTPPQQMSPNAQSAPSGRQHTFVPPWPGAHSRGKLSMQHSFVCVHASPGKVQVPSPPRHLETPDAEGSQPVDPPPFGQQLSLAPAPQTSPGSRQLAGLPQRKIGRPSSVVPFSTQAPEQHWLPVAHTSLMGRHPPRNSQVATPEPLSRQALEQQEPLMPVLPQGSPDTEQAPRLAQLPTIAPSGLSQ